MPNPVIVERPTADHGLEPTVIRSLPASRPRSTSALSRGAAVAALLVLAGGLPFLPLLEGLPAAHDLPDHVAMAESFQEGLAEGRLYPRWYGKVSLGWGEPTGLFYPPGLSFLASFTTGIAGGNTAHGLYLELLLLSVAGAAGIYRLLGPAAGRAGAVIAAFLFALAPYRAFELHGAGLLSAYAAGCLMPWLLAALWRVAVAPDGITGSVRPVAAVAASFALVTLFNLPAAVIVAYLVVVWAIVEAAARRSILVPLRAAAGGTWGALLAGVYLIPAIAERSLVRLPDAFDSSTFRSNFVFQTEGTWMEPDLVDIFSQMGFFPAALTAVSLVVIFARWMMSRGSTPGFPAASDLASLDRLLAGFAVLSLFLATEVSAPLWSVLPFLHNIYMPWRFLDPLALAAALLGGRAAGILLDGLFSPGRAASGRQGVRREDGLSRRIPVRALGIAAACGLAVVSILGGFLSKSVASMNGKVESDAVPYFARNYYARTGYFVPRSAALPQDLAKYPLIEVLTPEAGVEVLEWSSGRRVLRVQATTPSRLALRTYFYPGWVARSVSTRAVLPLSVEPGTGRMLLDVDSGRDDVIVRFEDTLPRSCAMALCVVALVSWILALVLTPRRPRPSIVRELTHAEDAIREAGMSKER
ncbi:MAG TPA: hypothetical protein VMT52_04360 [Planctomycetota bacterium]|nr:hypothetical protein [Planctomycetota bacterium]